MKLWRLHPRRSLRWQAKRTLRRARTVRGSAWARMRAAARLRRASWRPALLGALLVSAPLSWFVGKEASDWLNEVLQASAVLISLVLALVIFLLQAAGAQSLRAAASYRAMLGSTFLVWPLMLTLVYLGWTGVIMRFSDEGDSPAGWVETYALALFVLQLIGFGVVFVRLLRLVAPQGVLSVIEQAFTDDIARSVEAKLLRKAASERFQAASEMAGVSSGMWSISGSGKRIEAGRGGWVHDIDVRLPATVASYGIAEQTAIGVELGEQVNARTALAQADGVQGLWLTGAVRRAVAIRARDGDAGEPLPIFVEALDVARRAVREGGQGTVAGAVALLASCVEQLPLSYGLYGRQYTAAAATEGLLPTAEDELFHELRRFIRDVLASGRRDAIADLAPLGQRLVLSGTSNNAPYLVHQALRLWLAEVVFARPLTSSPVREQVFDQVSRLTKSTVQHLSSQLQEDRLSLEERFEVVPTLVQLFRTQTELLRLHADARDIAAFRNAWSNSQAWAPHWTPEHDLDDLEFRLSMATDARERGTLARAADRARALAETHEAVEDVRRWGTFQLGTWLMSHFRNGALNAGEWEQFMPYLVGAFPSHEALVGALSQVFQAEDGLTQLHNWQSETLTEDGGWQTLDYREAAVFWATLLLLRSTSPNQPTSIDLGDNAQWLVRQLLENVQAIESEPERWESTTGCQVAGRAGHLRAAIEESQRRADEQAERKLAAAELSEDRVTAFVDAQQESFGKHNHLRHLLGRAGALVVETHPFASSRYPYGRLLPKKWFVEQAQDVLVVGWDEFGQLAADREQQAVCDALAALAPQVEAEDPVSAAVEVIETMRAAGLEPDAVLVPSRVWVRPMLRKHPAFRWAGGTLTERPREMGYLQNVPVYYIFREDAGYLVVACLQGAMKLCERKRPSQAAPLRAEVRLIDESRAAELLDSGHVEWDQSKVPREDAVRQLVEKWAECFVDVDYRVVKGARVDDSLARVRLGPESWKQTG